MTTPYCIWTNLYELGGGVSKLSIFRNFSFYPLSTTHNPKCTQI